MIKRKDVKKMSKKLKKEELELMSYNDIANLLLDKETGKTTLDLFTEITNLLELPKETIDNKIGEFYTALTNDKRFTLTEDGKWDLRKNHKSQNLTIEEDLEDYEEDLEDYEEDLETEENEDIYSDDDDTPDVAEEYKNLVIVDEEDLEQN